MAHTRQPQVWILVADGERARVVVPDTAEGQFRTLLPLGAAEHPHYPPALRHDPHQVDKLRFATDVAARLNEEAERNGFDQLVLVAPGHILAAVREALGKTASARLVGALPRDYTKLPDDQLFALLAKWWLEPPTVPQPEELAG